ncbi:MAG TPA: hypothetical protein VKH44_07645, partial [Pirellulaceae bacterium]|nr:hypothetical protein [Pirellulaceae bacterium]
TEAPRRQRLAEINAEPGSREALEAEHGKVWTTDELTEEFEAIGFSGPYVVVRRRSDGVKGSLEFQHVDRALKQSHFRGVKGSHRELPGEAGRA